MNESSQQRLEEFRAEYRHARPALRLMPWLLIVAVLAIAVVAGVALLGGGAVRGNSGTPGLEPEAQRHLAAYLAEKKAYAASLEAYDDYLSQARLQPQDRAKVCYAAAKVAMEGELHERALARLYEAEWLKPDAELQRDIDAAVLTVLEHLGRRADLRSELRARAQLGRPRDEVGSGEVVLAEMADRVVTTRDLELALEKLPPAAREAFEAPEKKADLLKNIVAEHLLAEKARRQELDKDPEIQAMLSGQLNALMVRKLLQDEVQTRIHVTADDVQRYYKAEQQRFTVPRAVVVKTGRRAAGAEDAPFAFDGKTITIRDGQPTPALAGGDAAVAAILALEPGQQTAPYDAGDGSAVVYEAVSRSTPRVAPFEEVRGQVERELRQQKEQEQIQALIQSLLQTHNVRLYPERLEEPSR